MAIIVKKFGGTTVADVDKICKVANKIHEVVNAGNKVVVVVSAMGNETDNLAKLAHKITDNPDPRELDVLLASGEQVTIALLSMALLKLGCKARSYTGEQIKIITDSVHNKARITHIDTEKLSSALDEGFVTVVAGFQGIDKDGNITTVGRGGSDTTAVALAAALKADECQIYTDVDGVCTTDPKIVYDASQISEVTFEEMLEYSSLGAKVLELRSVECAMRNNVPVRVLPAFKEGTGTLVCERTHVEHKRIVSGIAFNREEAQVIIRGVPDLPGFANKILGPIEAANIEVDMVVQSIANNGSADFIFTVPREELLQVEGIVDEVANSFGAKEVLTNASVAKLSLVGIGMRSNTGIASKMFNALGDKGVNIQLITVSEIKVSVLIDEKHLESGVKVLHKAFEL